MYRTFKTATIEISLKRLKNTQTYDQNTKKTKPETELILLVTFNLNSS